MTDSGAGSPSSPARPPLLPWPPPGLEHLHAKIWPVIIAIAIADVVLVLPMLWAVTSERGVWSLGPFGTSWWVLLATSAIGLLVLLGGFERLATLLYRAMRASREGHARSTILEVVTDGPRDTGFVLQGARIYQHVPAGQRSTVLATRVVGTLAFLGAVLWVPFGFTVGVVLATRGLLGPGMVQVLTVIVPLGLIAIGLGGAYQETYFRRRARRDKSAAAATAEEIRTQIAEWNAGMAAHRKEIRFGSRSEPAAGSFRWGMIVTVLVAAAILVPLGILAFTSAVGPIVASIGAPSFHTLQAKIAVAGALERYRLDPDSSISAAAAGEALHTLSWVGRDRERAADERAPATAYDEPWFDPELDSIARSDSIFDVLRGPLTPAQRTALEATAAHAAHREWETVGRASGADIVTARYELPFADSTTPFTLSIPSFLAVRDGARAHIAKAAVEFSRGRPDRAEQMIREVLSAGFLMIDDGPTLFDNLIGSVLVRLAGDALESYYRARRQPREAETIAWVRSAAEHVQDNTGFAGVQYNLSDMLQTFPRIALDTTAVRGLRWEAFLSSTSFAQCINLHGIVFGQGERYDAWLAEAHDALVRRPSDEALFELFRHGWFGPLARTRGGLLATGLRIIFGKGGAAETCGGEVVYW